MPGHQRRAEAGTRDGPPVGVSIHEDIALFTAKLLVERLFEAGLPLRVDTDECYRLVQRSGENVPDPGDGGFYLVP
jgi:hypothetical protein